MYTFEWKPKIKENEAPVFSGALTVKIPKHIERMRALKGINLKIENGQVVSGDPLDAYEKQISFAISQIEKVDLLRLEDQLKFDSVDMLEHDKDGMGILSDLASDLAEGIKLGKNLLKK